MTWLRGIFNHFKEQYPTEVTLVGDRDKVIVDDSFEETNSQATFIAVDSSSLSQYSKADTFFEKYEKVLVVDLGVVLSDRLLIGGQEYHVQEIKPYLDIQFVGLVRSNVAATR